MSPTMVMPPMRPLSHAAKVGVIELGLGSLPGEERHEHMLDRIGADAMPAGDPGESLTPGLGQLVTMDGNS
jgi:hypothetical protein